MNIVFSVNNEDLVFSMCDWADVSAKKGSTIFFAY